jgi:hypothetical protein
MIYNLQVSGVIDPLVFSSGPGNFYCIINNPCSPFMMVNGGVIPITYSLFAGTLPPGVKLSGNTISGAATSTGTYNYTIQATDQVNQTATLQQTITVVPKLALLTTSLPSATVNIAMTVQLQATGGVPPYFWGIGGVLPANVLASIDGTGKLTYVATQPGTYNIPISISENTTYQQVSTTLPVTITP